MRIVFLCSLFLLSGCQYVALQSKQLSTIISVFYPNSESSTDVGWIVEFGGYSETVRPVKVKASTVFVNDLDTVSFDGWAITRVSGLSSFTPAWEIQDSGGDRSFVVQDQVLATHQCDPWSKHVIGTTIRYEQHCAAEKGYINIILVDGLGQITSIEQVVDSSLMVLRLRLDD